MQRKRAPICFMIENELLKATDNQAYEESTSRASIIRKALIKYLQENSKEMRLQRGRVIG